MAATVRMRGSKVVRLGKPEPQCFIGVDVRDSTGPGILFSVGEDFGKIQLFIQCVTARKNMATRAKFFCFRVEIG